MGQRIHPTRRPSGYAMWGMLGWLGSMCLLWAGCTAPLAPPQSPGQQTSAAPTPGRTDDLLVVDCLLPGQLRKLGRTATFLTARRPIKTSAQDCDNSVRHNSCLGAREPHIR